MNAVFMHLACMGAHWREIAAEVIQAIRASGLAEAAAHVEIGVSGSSDALGELRRTYPDTWITWRHHGEVIEACEFPTLEVLAEWCRRHPDALVLYCHTKGASKDFRNPFWRYWRRYMIDSSIRAYAKHVAALADHDASGDMWTKGTHFSGNFWWARAAHINELPDLRDLRSSPRTIYEGLRPEDNLRLQCEMWIGMRPGLRVKDHGITNMKPGFDLRIVGRPDASPCPLNTLDLDKIYLIGNSSGASSPARAQLRNIGLHPDLPITHWAVPIPIHDLIAAPATHRALLRDALTHGCRTICVMSDDLVVIDGFNEILAYAASQLPADWQLVYLACVERDGLYGFERRLRDSIAIPKAPRQVDAYLARTDAVRFIADRLDTAGLRVYSIVPSLAEPPHQLEQ